MAKRYALVGSDLDLIDDLVKHGNSVVGYFSTHDKENGFSYLGNHMKIANYQKTVNIIVAVDDPSFRKHLWLRYRQYLSGYISPDASISPLAKLRSSVVAYPYSYISANVRLGELVKVSVGAQIHHESEVNDFSVIGPQALLLGQVKVGEQSFICSGTKISPGTQVGSNVLVGMGSVVTRDIPSGSKAWGNPARVISENIAEWTTIE